MDHSTAITLTVTACSTVLVVGSYLLIKPAKRVWKKCKHLTEKDDSPVDEWDQVSLFYRVPGSTFGFLTLTYLVLWLSIGLTYGEEDLFSVACFFGVWLGYLHGLDSISGIIGAVGIPFTVIYGVYQDHLPSRMKTLAVLAFFGILLGLGVRFS